MESDLKARVVAYVAERQHVSFVELLRTFPEERGSFEMVHGHENTVMWSGLSERLIGVLSAAMADGSLIAMTGSAFAYTIDGGGMTLPVATRHNHAYKEPRWLPTFFNTPRRDVAALSASPASAPKETA